MYERTPKDTDESETLPKSLEDTRFTQADAIRLTKGATISPTSQMAVQVVSTATGLVYVEPKAAVQQIPRVRAANGVADNMP